MAWQHLNNNMANTPQTLQQLFEANQYNLSNAARKSRSWFDQQVTLMTKQQLTPQKVLKDNPDNLVNKIMPGSMYMFLYDPKTKNTLPYYDRFPLVLPYKKTPDGFMGLNLHYLPYQLRTVLLDRLMVFRNNSRMDETTRIKYSWATIEGISKFKLAEPCIKQYLDGHVRSRFKYVEPRDWATAMLLPVESFVGASKQAVWQQSNKIIRKA